ncbi:unannotated protein [freshwater metagenome]|uniref:Unannotated protein n=1 Tax=freshwater metagenome TaxID=449393 RepID=A0A6J6BNX3_9ZZZZ
MEVSEVVEGSLNHLDAGFFCLTNVATPLLVHTVEQIVNALVAQIKLKNKTRLNIAKAIAFGYFLVPAQGTQLCDQFSGLVV